jgi:hypothetical protein
MCHNPDVGKADPMAAYESFLAKGSRERCASARGRLLELQGPQPGCRRRPPIQRLGPDAGGERNKLFPGPGGEAPDVYTW